MTLAELNVLEVPSPADVARATKEAEAQAEIWRSAARDFDAQDAAYGQLALRENELRAEAQRLSQERRTVHRAAMKMKMEGEEIEAGILFQRVRKLDEDLSEATSTLAFVSGEAKLFARKALLEMQIQALQAQRDFHVCLGAQKQVELLSAVTGPLASSGAGLDMSSAESTRLFAAADSVDHPLIDDARASLTSVVEQLSALTVSVNYTKESTKCPQ